LLQLQECDEENLSWLMPIGDHINSVARLLSSNRVLLDLDVPNKQTLFEVVGRLWEVHRGMVAAEVVDSLNARS
jgi:hypothetical protein